jgi:phosphoglycolate phosphatase
MVLGTTLDAADLVLFDFDGPLCDVFAGYPAPGIAREIEELAGTRVSTDDPLEVLRYVAKRRSQFTAAVEDALVVAEVRAVERAEPNFAGVRALRSCLESGRRVGIVSNNSGDAVRRFLEAHDLTTVVAPVVGRSYRHPERMKPNEWPMRKAMVEAECAAGAAVFVGDSDSDIQVAQAVSMPCVAYANKPGKRELFESMGAIVIDRMSELTEALANC